MSTVLYIQASPRRERSKSVAVADAFIAAYREVHPDDRIETFNVFDANLPAFDGLAVEAKYSILHGADPSEDERRAWRAVEGVIRQFTAADKYVFAVPMWNFSVPYRLKQYIDLLVQPGYTFAFSPEEGYTGLVTGKPAFVAITRGGNYSSADSAALDHQKSYLQLLLGFIGFAEIRWAVAEPTLAAGPEACAAAVARAVETARAAAGTF